SNTSQVVTWTCTGSPCDWGNSLSGQALVWPAEMGAVTNRLGYTTSAGIYLLESAASGLTVFITSGTATIYAGLPDAASHRVLATISAGQSHFISGLATGEVVSVQGGDVFSFSLTPPLPATATALAMATATATAAVSGPTATPAGCIDPTTCNPVSSIPANWRCDIPECTSSDWVGSVIAWPAWAAYENNARAGDQSRTVFSFAGEKLYPYMPGSWAQGCQVTVVSGTAVIIEWQRGTNVWRETRLETGQNYTINLISPEDGAMIEGLNDQPFPGFSVSLSNCTPQNISTIPTPTPTAAATNTPVPPTATPAPVVNLAPNGTVSASSLEVDWLPAGDAIDGNTSTRWSSAYSDPQWLQVDLGQMANISRVVLNWETAYGRAYAIQVSNDGNNWTTIYSTTTSDGGVDDLTGLSGSGRYVRMYGTARGTQWGYSLWEFEVYGSPVVVTPSPTNTPVPPTATATAISGSGQILREWWSGIGGTSVSNLTSNANYPNNPSGSDLLTSFEAPTNWADNYGTRLRGYLYPPVSGQYRFWIAGDDNSELWLSTDESSANAVRIANVPGWSNSREWNKFSEQQSSLITLQAGQRYYIEALQKEGGGGDHLAVAWQIPGGSQQVIAGQYLSPFQPTNPAPTATATNTPVPPTATATATNTPVPPTATPSPTNTPVPPTATPVPVSVNMCSTSSSTAVSGNLYDNGGPNGNYSSSRTCGFLIDPPGNGAVTLSFTAFNLENWFDTLTIYDGSNTSGLRLGQFTGSSIPASLTAQSGQMYILFSSNFWITRSGFAASWSTTAEVRQAVTSFTLVNADTDQDITTITNGATINLASLPTRNLNVRANTDPGIVGSVLFQVNGSDYRIENIVPYALGSDDGNGDYAALGFGTGQYTLTARPYTGSSASGTAGTALTISFTVINQ
ncbi:MAG: discoidin domain-containing protein, partial [Anaerolineae bacterium]|nr:discoidin domain-containing protein [Anaerolineae bacterium]